VNFIIGSFGKETCNAYVVFASKDSVQPALKENNVLIEDHHIRVDIVSNDSKTFQNTIFVGNLPLVVNEEEIRAHFESCGTITNVRLIRDPKFSMGKGFGFVTFEDKEGFKSGINMNGTIFNKRPLRVFKASEKAVKKKKQNEDNFSNPAERRIAGKGKRTQYEGMRAQKNKIPRSLQPSKPQKKQKPKHMKRKLLAQQQQQKITMHKTSAASPKNSFNYLQLI